MFHLIAISYVYTCLLVVSNDYLLHVTPFNQKERSTQHKENWPTCGKNHFNSKRLSYTTSNNTYNFLLSEFKDRSYLSHASTKPSGHQVICFYLLLFQRGSREGSQRGLPDNRISYFYSAVTEMGCKILPSVTLQEQSPQPSPFLRFPLIAEQIVPLAVLLSLHSVGVIFPIRMHLVSLHCLGKASELSSLFESILNSSRN